MALPKMNWFCQYGSDEHKAMVHAYYHLMQYERGERMVAVAKATGETGPILRYWQDYAKDQWRRFEEQADEMPNLILDYLTHRQLDRIGFRMILMTKEHPPEERARRERIGKRKKAEFLRSWQTRYN